MSTLSSVTHRVRSRRVPVVAIVTYSIAVLAWLAVVGRFLPMPGHGASLRMTDPGMPEAMALSNGVSGIALYLLMWGVMMVAMMYPSSVPLFRLYANTLNGKTRGTKLARLGAFVGTYTLVWTLTGLVALAVNAVVPLHAIAAGNPSVLFGSSLLLLSGYQLSPYKDRCLRYCRTPIGFLMEYHRPGLRGAVETSARFSLFCVGCCWALFAVMVVVGSMNILWMGVITLVLSAERVVGWGERLAQAIGAAAGVGGGALLVLAVL